MTEELRRQIAGFLGLCARARQITLGQESCVAAVRAENTALALLDQTSGPTTRKRFMDSCASHGIPLYELPEGLISQALGKQGRICATLSPGPMARRMLALLEGEPTLRPAGAIQTDDSQP